MLGLDPLVLIRHQSDDQTTANHVFPLYGYRGSETEGSRFSLIGFPLSQGVTWARYAQERTPTLKAARRFPFFEYRNNERTHEQEWDAIGIDPVTLVRYRAAPDLIENHVFSFYGYRRDGANRRFTALGLPLFSEGPALSLLEVADGPTRSAHRFTPVYAYAHDRDKDDTSMNALYLYWYARSKQVSRNSAIPLGSFQTDEAAQAWGFTLLFPPWHYDTDRNSGETRLGIVGWVPFSLYQAVTTPTQQSHRLFPVYTHRRDLVTGRGETDVL